MLSKERKGEIALALLMTGFEDEGMHLNPDFRDELPELSQKIGISLNEVTEFFEGIVSEIEAKNL